MSEDLQRLQAIEQSLQTFSLQKQNIQSQLLEIESALKEIGGETYRIIGNIMVKTDAEKLKEELTEKQSVLTNRLETAEKQEARLRKEAEQLQKELMDSMEKK